VKPHNLFLVGSHCKVGDFGLVQPHEGTPPPASLGLTPGYASPELFEGCVSRYSDQYSLAVVYQELLTGKRPFNGNSVHQLLVQHASTPPDLSLLPEADRPIVARALAKVPGERFDSCGVFIRALEEVADESVPLSQEPGERIEDTLTMAGMATLR